MDERRQHPDRRAEPRGGRREDDAQAFRDRVSGRVQRILNARRMTIRRLGVLAALSERTVSNLLEGRNINLDTLHAVAWALDVPLSDLISPRNTKDISAH